VGGFGVHVNRSASALTALTSGDLSLAGTRPCAAMTSSRRTAASCKARQPFPLLAAAATADARLAHSRASTRGTPGAACSCGCAEDPQPARSTTRAAATRIFRIFRGLPAIGPNVAFLFRSVTVKVLLMPMLHGCAFPGCSTFTLSTYCVEHELLVRALKESERTQHAALVELEADAPMTAELESGGADVAQQPAQL
jgi:hypothetical protein